MLPKLALLQIVVYLICSLLPQNKVQAAGERSFEIDYDHDRFLKDGEPFRYISGSIHYFRVPQIYWQDRLDKMKAAGLNAIQTYVEWNQHEAESEVYNFEGNLDLVQFLQLANDTGLLVVLRAGPYIDAEREFGGLPYWLLHNNQDMNLRSSDPSYLKFVDRWWTKLFGLIKPMLYVNGGPVISIQIENEYGSYHSCDQNYTVHLRDLARSLVGPQVVLFTTDGHSEENLRCGKIPEVYATIDFGPETDVASAFEVLRKFEPHGPLVNSEFYTGWLDHWGEPHFRPNKTLIAQTLDEILALNASVNMYMFHGGTSFGFSSAPLSEAGDPTDLYMVIRDVIKRHVEVPPGKIPPATPKKNYGTFYLRTLDPFWMHQDAAINAIFSKYPQSFEQVGQAYGFLTYVTQVSQTTTPQLLEVPDVRDRAYVVLQSADLNFHLVGILSRIDKVFSVNMSVVEETMTLYLFVENQGRVCFGEDLRDFKGVLSNVTFNGKVLTDWYLSSAPLNDTSFINVDRANDVEMTEYSDGQTPFVPRFYVGHVVIPEGEEPCDTFLNTAGWTKGIAFINGFNLGRYWPAKGPQVTLYVPKSVIRRHPYPNYILLMEQDGPPENGTLTMKLQDTPIIAALADSNNNLP